jgi:hypothetical protein
MCGTRIFGKKKKNVCQSPLANGRLSTGPLKTTDPFLISREQILMSYMFFLNYVCAIVIIALCFAVMWQEHWIDVSIKLTVSLLVGESFCVDKIRLSICFLSYFLLVLYDISC